jgi:hypothetical protein
VSAEFSQQGELSRLQSRASKMRIIENRYPADGLPQDGAVARRWWRRLVDHITHSSKSDSSTRAYYTQIPARCQDMGFAREHVHL